MAIDNPDAPSQNSRKATMTERSQPHADIGVLLVHGIGDHKEGETLTSFGEPLLDWLREWLRDGPAPGGRPSVDVIDGRLRATRTEAESPAYALASIHAPAKDREEPAVESWLFCEAWWGDSVQPPVALRLLKWLWSRGPLLIYWHFYLKTGIKDIKELNPTDRRDVQRALVAILLSMFSQTVVALALALWVIPIGKWRRAVVSAVRTLTLTLGDSYVLLENDIQRTALIQRVRHALSWLTERCDKAVVIAHSQGGAIAYEALRATSLPGVHAFVSIGSGLEKLQFLRRVRDRRKGVLLAPLLAPLLACAIAVLISGMVEQQPWQIGVGFVMLITAITMGVILIDALNTYRTELVAEAGRSQLTRGTDTSQPVPITWVDISASHDVVPVVAGSLIAQQPFVEAHVISNQESYVNDHVTYFQDGSRSLPLMWLALQSLSRLQLFKPGQVEGLARCERLHSWYAFVLTWSRRSTFAALALCLVVFRKQLVDFGTSVIAGVDGSPAGDLLKPVRAAAAVAAWIIQLVRSPQQAVSDTLAPAIVGGVILTAGLTLWLVAFKALWRAGARRRWRLASRVAKPIENRTSEIPAYTLCALFMALGLLPLAFVAILIVMPGVLSPQSVENAISAALALLCVVLSLFFAVVTPWSWRQFLTDDQSDDAHLVQRPLFPLITAFLILLVLQAVSGLWPYGGSVPETALPAVVWTVHAFSWQVWTIMSPRPGVSVLERIALVAAPVLGVAVQHVLPALRDLTSPLLVYNVVAVLAPVADVLIRTRAIVAEAISAVPRIFFRSLRSRFPFGKILPKGIGPGK